MLRSNENQNFLTLQDAMSLQHQLVQEEPEQATIFLTFSVTLLMIFYTIKEITLF